MWGDFTLAFFFLIDFIVNKLPDAFITLQIINFISIVAVLYGQTSNATT